MLDNETYKKELIRMWDSIRETDKGSKSCSGISCKDCPLNVLEYGCANTLSAVETYSIVEKWSREHPNPKHKVSQLEYDILKSYIDDTKFVYYFYDSDLLMSLLKRGYFQGAKNETDIYEYIKNCEIEDNKK